MTEWYGRTNLVVCYKSLLLHTVVVIIINGNIRQISAIWCDAKDNVEMADSFIHTCYYYNYKRFTCCCPSFESGFERQTPHKSAAESLLESRRLFARQESEPNRVLSMTAHPSNIATDTYVFSWVLTSDFPHKGENLRFLPWDKSVLSSTWSFPCGSGNTDLQLSLFIAILLASSHITQHLKSLIISG